MADDLSDPRFWNDIYLREQPGWDKGAVSPPLARLAREVLAPGASVVVLGAGRGHDAAHLASLGFRVTAVDFAEEAAKAMRARGGFEVLQADVFTLAKTHAGAFDAACEHTCFCAIDPKRRREYAEVVHAIVKRTFFGLFYESGKTDGPPHTTSEEEVRKTFGDLFEIERLRRAPDGFPERLGRELEFVFTRR